MSFENNRKALKLAVEKSPITNHEQLVKNNRRQARSYTLRPDVINAINKAASQQNVSSSHLVEQILINHFDLS